ICLLLASHAPVNQIITGHLPRVTPVRPGILVPIRPIDPGLVRVGMQVGVWQGATVVASGLVEDLNDAEVSARIQDTKQATLDTHRRAKSTAPALTTPQPM